MFDLPSRQDLSSRRDEEFNNWFDSFRQSDVVVTGSGPAGFCAGIVLVDHGYDVLVVEESEQIGGRLFWKNGPVPVVSPADELLEELGLSIESNPPIWLDRVELMDFLLHRLLRSGGRVVPGIYIDAVAEDGESRDVSLRIDERRETIETGDIVVTDTRLDLELPVEDGETPMESMVLNTAVTPGGWIGAGYQALAENQRDMDYPFVNAECLSGRKAAELVMAGE